MTVTSAKLSTTGATGANKERNSHTITQFVYLSVYSGANMKFLLFMRSIFHLPLVDFFPLKGAMS